MSQPKSPIPTQPDGAPLAPEELQYVQTDLGDIVMDPKPRMTPYGEQDDNGVDLSLIRHQLRRTPLERSEANYRGALQFLDLRWYARYWQAESARRAGRPASIAAQ
jgi:hypothetical protein